MRLSGWSAIRPAPRRMTVIPAARPNARACPQLDHRESLSSTGRITGRIGSTFDAQHAAFGWQRNCRHRDSTFGASGSTAIVTGTELWVASSHVVSVRHVHTVASSGIPGWRSRRKPELSPPHWRPAPASASQS
jgi:hypothetical protein